MTDRPAEGAGAERPGRRVMISCGEASGDLYAAALAVELRALDPATDVVGYGGDQLAGAGATLLDDYRGSAVTGLVEAARVIPRSLRTIRTLADDARARRPDVFVAIDLPDFNFRLLPIMHELDVPVVYYVSPQIWAWRPRRVDVLHRYVKRMLVIFPFEVELYQRAGVPVEFVGHPLVDLAKPTASRDDWRRTHHLDPARPVLALLPGSRPNEVRRLLPVMQEACALVAREVPGVQFLLARAPGLDDAHFASMRGDARVTIVAGATDDVLAASDAVITASSTATVQAALHGCPMVVVYRLSRLTYAMGRLLVRVPHVGMVNIVAGREVVPELIQDQLTPTALAREAVSLLTDEARAARVRADLAVVRSRLGGPGASRRAAAAVLGIAGLHPLH